MKKLGKVKIDVTFAAALGHCPVLVLSGARSSKGHDEIKQKKVSKSFWE
ncbi:hypothetical protein [Snuella sedimenti]|uniref:Uncharacterized protein n=1 Tax=Snuella sedimenti TaxID=2798802 RepID=A0A8J7J1M6_9FLAO|nr:hypothetical protein [Snuella sedimenti]MBJ6367349.1 hypothetical protein [Snuella sedimenti]